MVDSAQIGATETFYFLLCTGIVFASSLSPITMWNYWTDTLYSAHPTTKKSSTGTSGTATADEDVQQKALKVARVKTQNWWATWGLLIFDVIGKCFLVASFYRVVAVDGTESPGTRYTTKFVFLFITIGLDKAIPSMIHYFTYQKANIWCSIYSVVHWLFNLLTLIFLFTWNYGDSYYAGGLFIPYFAYDTAMNITMWAMFWGKDAYTMISTVGTKRNGTPGQPADHLYSTM